MPYNANMYCIKTSASKSKCILQKCPDIEMNESLHNNYNNNAKTKKRTSKRTEGILLWQG